MPLRRDCAFEPLGGQKGRARGGTQITILL